jgi:hypothetical protein
VLCFPVRFFAAAFAAAFAISAASSAARCSVIDGPRARLFAASIVVFTIISCTPCPPCTLLISAIPFFFSHPVSSFLVLGILSCSLLFFWYSVYCFIRMGYRAESDLEAPCASWRSGYLLVRLSPSSAAFPADKNQPMDGVSSAGHDTCASAGYAAEEA